MLIIVANVLLDGPMILQAEIVSINLIQIVVLVLIVILTNAQLIIIIRVPLVNVKQVIQISIPVMEPVINVLLGIMFGNGLCKVLQPIIHKVVNTAITQVKVMQQ